jgi:hypothetical protein
MADNFTRDRFLWLDRVLSDSKVSAQAFAVAYVLATMLNRKTGQAWPAIPTIAARVNKSPRRTQGAIGELINRGHLSCQRGGKGRANRYEILDDDRTEVSDQEELRTDESVRSTEVEPGRNRPINQSLIGRFQRDDRTESSVTYGRYRPPNPLNEPFEDSIDRESLSPAVDLQEVASEVGDHFHRWYLQYPRRVARQAAEKAYRKIIEKGLATHDELTTGAMRYAAERDREQDPEKRVKFTAHPATWLNNGQWKDEVAPQPSPARQQQPSRQRGGFTEIAMRQSQERLAWAK